jgi:hypothetical protein
MKFRGISSRRAGGISFIVRGTGRGKPRGYGRRQGVNAAAIGMSNYTFEQKQKMKNPDSRTLEEAYRSAVSGLYARLKSNYDFICRKYGNDGLKLIADMSREYGLSLVPRAQKKLKNNDIHSVALYILRIFDTVSRHKSHLIELVEISNTRVVIKAGYCPLNFTDPDMCLAHTAMEKALVEGLNPGFRYRIGKSIPKGAPYCEHIIELKSSAGNSSWGK